MRDKRKLTAGLAVLAISLVLTGCPSDGHLSSKYSNGGGSVVSGNTVKIMLKNLMPGGGQGVASSFPRTGPIIFAGNTGKIITMTTPGGWVKETLYYNDTNLNGSGAHTAVEEMNTASSESQIVIVRPFNGGVDITVPEGANAVRFEITWDLTGAIEQYQGSDGSSNNADDVFVLKKGFWETLSINAVIE